MDTKIQKILKIISFILFEGILFLAAGLLGMQNEKNRILQEEEAETVTDIAIVNLDQGVYEDNKIHYYSNELMNLELDNLVSENLEMARQGINNGSYAAYILIPAEFSQNAVSINSVPQKSVLEFAVNPNLREDVSRLTMANIKNFEINLNTNMAYMYVQAILEEFHNVQDSAGTIIDNDNKEMARLMQIAPDSLMSSPEPFEVEWINPDIEEADFNGIFESNSQISKALRDNYESFAKEGKEAFDEIKAKEVTVTNGMDEFLEAVAEIDVATDENGNIVYEEGISDLYDYTEQYELEFLQKKNQVYERIDAMSYITPVPIPKPSSTPGDGTPTPSILPTSTPTELPLETPSAENASPEKSPLETGPAVSTSPSVSPSVKSIPQMILETMEESLQKANAAIEERNNQNKETRDKIQEIIGKIRLIIEVPEGNQQRNILKRASDQSSLQDESEAVPSVMPTPTETEETLAPTEQEETLTPSEEEDIQIIEEPLNITLLKKQNYRLINALHDSGMSSDTWLDMGIESGDVTSTYVTSLTAEQIESLGVYLNELEEEVNKIQETPKMTIEEIYEEDTIRQEFKQLAQMIQELPTLDIQEYKSMFEEGVMKPLETEIQTENARVQDEGGKYMETLDAYMEELELFDPYEYYDYEKVDDLDAAFAENIYNLEEKVYESHDGYLEFVYDSVDRSNESMTSMQENLEEVYGKTKENIGKEVDLAKQYRQLMNETNVEILGDFKGKLPYTRIGNLEYVQAYDFIVNPIKMSDTSIGKSRVLLFQDYTLLKKILIVMIIVWCVMICSLLGIKAYSDSHKNTEGE